VNIIELIGSYSIECKKMGSRYKVKCPFHKETQASLTVYPQNNTWFCFGCRKGGDMIQWIMEYERCGYTQARRKLGLDMHQPEEVDHRKAKAEAVKRFEQNLHSLKGLVFSGLIGLVEKQFINCGPEILYKEKSADIFNKWREWDTVLNAGSDKEKYELATSITVKDITNDLRYLEWI